MEVVGNGDEADLGGYFFEASQAEPSEPFVLFDVPEYRLYLPPLSAFLDSQVAFEQLFYLLPVADQVCASLDDAVSLGFVAGAAHRAALAVLRLIEPVCLNKAVCRFSLSVADMRHGLADRAVVSVGLSVVKEIVGSKRVCFVFLVRSLFVEVAIFDERRDASLLQKVVVLFAPVSGVGRQVLRY